MQPHLTVYIHGPHDAPQASLMPGDRPFASVNTGGASIFVSTPAEADALIIAFVAAKDMLLSAQAPADAGRCDVDWGNATASQRCVHEAGHSGPHADAAGWEWSDAQGEPHAHLVTPGTCLTCGVTVTADGIVHAAFAGAGQ